MYRDPRAFVRRNVGAWELWVVSTGPVIRREMDARASSRGWPGQGRDSEGCEC